MYQTPTPTRLTSSLAADWFAAEKERGRKLTAAGTPFRYSSAGDCARYLAYNSMVPEGAPSTMDAAGVWVTGLGTRIHEWLQESLEARFPNIELEVPTTLGLTSGHCDAVIPEDDMKAVFPDWNGGRVLFELKTMGMTKWDKQTGLKRRYRKWENPAGPAVGTIIQSGLNAMANDCDTVIVGAIALEAVSVGVAEAMGMGEFDRFVAEWTIPEEVWRPAAEAELKRLERIKELLDNGLLPAREEVTDVEGTITPINFEKHWKCNGYCEFADVCANAGEGIVEIGEDR